MQSHTEADLLAHHWERAEDFEQALECRLEAATRASDIYALPEAITQYLLALDLVERLQQTKETGQRHLETVAAVMRATGLTGSASYQDEEQRERFGWHLDKAMETAKDRGDYVTLARLEAYKGIYWMDEAYLAQAVRDAEAYGDKSVHA